MAWTFDLTTDRGKVRLLCTDSDITSQVFDDSEIDAFLALAPPSVFTAAALACETWARSRSKLSMTLRNVDGSSLTRYAAHELLALAKSLREAPLKGGLITDTISTSSPGELLDSFRPEWRGINDVPIVE